MRKRKLRVNSEKIPLWKAYPIGSMCGIFTCIGLNFMVHVGKYKIHGSYDTCAKRCLWSLFQWTLQPPPMGTYGHVRKLHGRIITYVISWENYIDRILMSFMHSFMKQYEFGMTWNSRQTSPRVTGLGSSFFRLIECQLVWSEPTKKPFYCPLCWSFNRGPYNGFDTPHISG